jgi:hypothetical protein
MTTLEYSNPAFASADNRSITCQITLASGVVLPFTASLDDPEPHGRMIHEAISGNADTPVAAFVPEPEKPALPASGSPPEDI